MYIVARQIREDVFIKIAKADNLEEAQIKGQAYKEMTKYKDVCILEE